MKNLMVANCQKKGRYAKENIERYVKAQIENSISLGWKPKDIILITNFSFKFMGVRATKIKLNKKCLTGSKMWALKYIFSLIDDEYPIITEKEEIFWAHDLDAWQNIAFSPPEMKDVGITTYSNSKYNGGSVFWRPWAKDIVNDIIKVLEKGQNKEEPTLNKMLKNDEYNKRVTVINNTYNVGCSGFVKRLNRSEKPIKVCHFHPTNRIAWETHALDRNGIGERSIGERLEKLLRKHYLLANKVTSK